MRNIYIYIEKAFVEIFRKEFFLERFTQNIYIIEKVFVEIFRKKIFF